MKGICPHCEDVRALERIDVIEEVKVKGDLIRVRGNFLKCMTCNEEFNDPDSPYDQVDAAFREYRKKHGMLQPEEIKKMREQFSLTQAELSKLLGWGLATLSRYENGALQEQSHDKSLRLALEPRNLLKLIHEASDAFSSAKKRERLIRELEMMEEGSHNFEYFLEERYGSYRADEYSGYKRLDFPKFMNAILFFCKEGVFKTKLNKLLFYADFKHFKDYAESITGARYARLPHGPVPDKFDHYYAALIHEDEALRVDEVCFEKYCGEEFISTREPDLSVFATTELMVLAMIKDKFQRLSAKDIRDYSHDERGYIETQNAMLISYNYARDLQL